MVLIPCLICTKCNHLFIHCMIPIYISNCIFKTYELNNLHNFYHVCIVVSYITILCQPMHKIPYSTWPTRSWINMSYFCNLICLLYPKCLNNWNSKFLIKTLLGTMRIYINIRILKMTYWTCVGSSTFSLPFCDTYDVLDRVTYKHNPPLHDLSIDPWHKDSCGPLKTCDCYFTICAT